MDPKLVSSEQVHASLRYPEFLESLLPGLLPEDRSRLLAAAATVEGRLLRKGNFWQEMKSSVG